MEFESLNAYFYLLIVVRLEAIKWKLAFRGVRSHDVLHCSSSRNRLHPMMWRFGSGIEVLVILFG